MSNLIVNTLPHRNSIAAFVAGADGKPALGLGPGNFKVGSALPGSDGAHLIISGVSASPLRGFYVLNLEPASPAIGRKGLHVFDLIVEEGERRGQALSSVIMTY